MNAIRLRIWAIYQNARNETMKAMSEARCNPFKEFYRSWDKNRDHMIYKVAKNGEREQRKP